MTVLAMCNMAFADGNGVVVTARSSDDCQVTPVIHVLQYPGCVPKPIPSFACTGRCSSYLQVKQFYKQYIYLYHKWKLLFKRFLGQKYGKWKGLACVVKKVVNVKLQCHYFVQKPNKARKNLERYSIYKNLFLYF